MDFYSFPLPTPLPPAHKVFLQQYEKILQRREEKWARLCGSEEILPKRGGLVKRYVEKGVPRKWRRRVWLHYSGAEQVAIDTPDLYTQLVQADKDSPDMVISELVERDLHRTLPDHPLFRCTKSNVGSPVNGEVLKSPHSPHIHTAPGILALRRVLMAFARHHAHIGYCQSLNFLAAMLLVIFALDPENEMITLQTTGGKPPISIHGEAAAFFMLHILVIKILPIDTYSQSMIGAQVEQRVFWEMIGRRWPWLRFKIDGGVGWGCGVMNSEPDPNGTASIKSFNSLRRKASKTPQSPTGLEGGVITMGWFLTCFASVLPTESLLRVWDCLFYNGHGKTICQVASGVLKLSLNTIKDIEDPFEIVSILQGFPKQIWNCQLLIEAMHNKPRSRVARFTKERIDILRSVFRSNVEIERATQAAKREELAKLHPPSPTRKAPPIPESMELTDTKNEAITKQEPPGSLQIITDSRNLPQMASAHDLYQIQQSLVPQRPAPEVPIILSDSHPPSVSDAHSGGATTSSDSDDESEVGWIVVDSPST